MRRLADALALDEGSFDIRSNKGGPAVSGEGTLRGEDVWVQLSLGLSGPDREVCFRKVQGRDDHLGDRNCWASIRELVDPGRFAARIRRELRLSTSQRSEEHPSELQSLMRISYAVFCLKKKKKQHYNIINKIPLT